MKNAKKPAYSLIYAFLVMVIIMIIATTTIQNVRGKVIYFGNIESSSKAHLAAESAAEEAVMAIKEHDAGYDPSDAKITPDSTDPETYGNYEVHSKAEENDFTGGGKFYTPIPNSGDAAPSNDCSVLKNDLDPDNPCNWNILRFGGVTTVPMYSDDSLSGLQSPLDLGLTSWQLRVRTPCKPDGSGNPVYECDGDQRYELACDYDNDGDCDNSDYKGDDSLILWQLIGYDKDQHTTLKEVPEDATLTFPYKSRDLRYNTEIYESLVNETALNATSRYTVLEANKTSTDARYSDLFNVCTDSSIERLILQMEVVTPLKDMDGSTVPYLEWQLITNSTYAPADQKVVIVSHGYHKSNFGLFSYPYVITRSTINQRTNSYTISN